LERRSQPEMNSEHIMSQSKKYGLYVKRYMIASFLRGHTAGASAALSAHGHGRFVVLVTQL
jgi:hypothetical protein